MPMPEASVHEDDATPTGEHEVRFAWQRAHMETKPVAKAMRVSSDRYLRSSVT